MATEQIRILRVEGRAVGMDVVTTSLDRVSGAANRVTVASDGMTAAQTRAESKTISMSKAFETAQSRLDMQYRIMQQVAREQLVLDRARDQGITSLGRYNELTALNNARLNDNATASSHSAKAIGLNAAGFQNLGYQINDIVTGLASGQSPFMILAQQGGQVQQILSAGQGGIAGSLKSIGSAVSSMITPSRLAFGGLAAGA